MISKDGIEAAYCFIHQKYRVYAHSNSETQKDEIEYAISSFVEQMNPELYTKLSQGNRDFLLSHATFAADMERAEAMLETLL